MVYNVDVHQLTEKVAMIKCCTLAVGPSFHWHHHPPLNDHPSQISDPNLPLLQRTLSWTLLDCQPWSITVKSNMSQNTASSISGSISGRQRLRERDMYVDIYVLKHLLILHRPWICWALDNVTMLWYGSIHFQSQPWGSVASTSI